MIMSDILVKYCHGAHWCNKYRTTKPSYLGGVCQNFSNWCAQVSPQHATSGTALLEHCWVPPTQKPSGPSCQLTKTERNRILFSLVAHATWATPAPGPQTSAIVLYLLQAPEASSPGLQNLLRVVPCRHGCHLCPVTAEPFC